MCVSLPRVFTAGEMLHCEAPTGVFRLHPSSTLVPYTTLFRSLRARRHAAHRAALLRRIQFLADGHHRETESVGVERQDRKSTRLNSSHGSMSYGVFCSEKTDRRSSPVSVSKAARSMVCRPNGA